MASFNVLRHIDKRLGIAAAFLLGISLATLFGIGVRDGEYSLFLRQSVWLGIGLAAFFIFASYDYRILRGARGFIIVLYLAGALVLTAVLIFGADIRGTNSWFRIGWISIEPIEILKLVLVIVLAQYFSLRHIESYRIHHIAISAGYMALYVALVFLQPDIGSALILIGIWFGVVLISGIKAKQLFGLITLFAVLFMAGWLFYFADYQKERITAFLRPGYDPQGIGYNVRQALIAIGAGGFLGQGIAGGSQVQLYFLPEAETDFIFAAIGEYFGFLGMLLTILSIGYILSWCFFTTLDSKNNFARLTAMGFFFSYFIQSGIHIAMNLGIFPVTGVPLPLVSYGGSSLVSTFISLGIIQSIAIRNKLGYPKEPIALG